MADLICAKCKQPIEESNAIECPFCWEVYHKECWEDTEICETCRKYNPIYEIVQKQKEVEVQNSQNEETETQYNEIESEEEMSVDFNGKEMPSSPVANSVFLASIVALASGIAGGIAFAIYMMFPMGRDYVGVIGGLAIAGLGVALMLAIKGFAELINNSQKNAFYLSKLVEKQKEKDE